MSSASPPAGSSSSSPPQVCPIYIQQPSSLWTRLRSWVIYTVLTVSVLLNVQLLGENQSYFSAGEGPIEKYHSGEKLSKDRIVLIQVSGAIMPPLTGRVIKDIKHARKDDNVKAVVLQVNSPGGLVSDSHQIYEELKKLSEKKTVVCSMQGLAASGGLYIAMGVGKSGKIFAEQTTWTGSIGVIIPRYDASKLAESWGVKAVPLKTGPYKDALSPFRGMTPEEEKVWRNILNQAFEGFLGVIADNRPKLDLEKVRALATGEIFTAKDALAKGLVDAIGSEDDVIEEARKMTHLEKARVVTYSHAAGLLEILGGWGQAQPADPQARWNAVIESLTPRAMYYFSWGIPTLSRTEAQ